MELTQDGQPPKVHSGVTVAQTFTSPMLGGARGVGQTESAATITWLLRDEFTDVRAAGAVNGTSAVPGPGTRTVNDTTAKLSINGTNLVLAGGASAWGDPGLWYGAFVRTAGRVLVFKTAVADTTHFIKYGLDVNQAGNITEGHYFISGAADRSVADNCNVAVYAAATTYNLAVVVRSTGIYQFIKGGAFGQWTLLWRTETLNNTPLYPVVANYDATGTVDWIRMPDELWLPTPLAYDSFTRANGALGNSETTGPDAQAITGRAWTDNVGTWAVAGNVGTCTALAGGLGIATLDTGETDTLTRATLTRAGNEVGVVVRYVDADNYIRAIHDGTNCQLIKRVATVETTVTTAAVALGAGKIVVISDGTSFDLFLNGSKVGATGTIADAALQTGTRQGMFTTNVGNTLDLFCVDARSGYTGLNRWTF